MLDRIKFIIGDVLDLLPKVRTDAVYFDPPWGGIDYQKLPLFRFGDFSPDGRDLIEAAMKKNMFIAFSLPRNFDPGELSTFSWPFQFEAAILNNRVWFNNLYIPAIWYNR